MANPTRGLLNAQQGKGDKKRKKVWQKRHAGGAEGKIPTPTKEQQNKGAYNKEIKKKRWSEGHEGHENEGHHVTHDATIT